MVKQKYNIIGVKSQLAKLMATENISVEHGNVNTASFDLIARVLTLPNWDNVTNELYDLLVGHEVGHALDTPNYDIVKQAYEEISPDHSLAKSFINVIEDARIEKLIKRRYPGLRRQFVAGYKELLDRNFFEINGLDVNKLGLLDRINLYFKLGHVNASNIAFFDDEKPFIARIENAETFAEVVQICKDLYAFLKQRNQIIQVNMIGAGQPDGNKSAEKSDNMQKNSDQTSGAGKTGAGQKSTSKSDEKSNEESAEKSDETGSAMIESTASYGDEQNDSAAGFAPELDENNNIKNDDEEKPSVDDNSAGGADGGGRFSPTKMQGQPGVDPMISKTDEAFDRAKSQLSNRTYAKNYVNIPVFDPSEVVITHKEIHANLKKHYAQLAKNSVEMQRKSFNKFKQDNNNVISYMLREFEVKKAADEYARITTARTGVLDTNKIHTYRYNDDLFRRVSIRPGSKNHGITMFIDLSGSMSDCMAGTIEQVMVLTMFCRRAQIAFEVYGFSDNVKNQKIANLVRASGSTGENFYARHRQHFKNVIGKGNVNDIALQPFALKQYITSNMSVQEYNEALLHLWYIRSNYTHREYHMDGNPITSHLEIPAEEGLGGTPLNEAIIAARYVVEQFQKKNKLQVVSAVFLTDGEGAPLCYKIDHQRKVQGCGHGNDVFNDRNTGRQYTGNGNRASQTTALLNALRDYTSARIIGFYLGNRYALRGAVNMYNEDYSIHGRNIDKNKFTSIKAAGYDDYFLVNSSALEIKDNELGTGKTVGSMAKEFSKYIRGKAVNRVLLSRFITLIAS